MCVCARVDPHTQIHMYTRTMLLHTTRTRIHMHQHAVYPLIYAHAARPADVSSATVYLTHFNVSHSAKASMAESSPDTIGA